jgi:MSHA biogenesis protein MshO
MRVLTPKIAPGFTLIEVIAVIVILGVLANSVTSFIKFSTQIYSEASDRDQLIASTRFAIERLNRDVRNALPNSLRLGTNNLGINDTCLEFVPIISSVVYTDIPITPEAPTQTLKVRDPHNDLNFANPTDLSVIVFPQTTTDVYSTNSEKKYAIDSISSVNTTTYERDISLDVLAQFPETSPVDKLYIVQPSNSVKYCLETTELKRNDVLMAENIQQLSFDLTSASLTDNALVRIIFTLQKNNEEVIFNHEIKVLNVP